MALDIIKYSSTALTRHDNKHDFFYRNKCNACPLKAQPKVDAYGSKKPIVYILGEAPGREEVEQGKPFVGMSGQMVRKHIPEEWLADKANLRWGNCLRSRPPKNRTPTPVEMACCRTFVEDDIIATKPIAVFGFGAVTLQWFGLADSNISLWAGRHIPVTIKGSTGQTHTCWYFPFLHPSYVCRRVDEERGDVRAGFKSEIEFAFHTQLKRAFKLVETIEEAPPVQTRTTAMEGVEWTKTFDRAAADRILRFIDSLWNEEVVGFDYETNALRPYNGNAQILTAALAGSRGTLAFPLHHREAKWPPQLLQELLAVLFTFLAEAPCIKAVHNAAFEMEWTAVKYKRASIRSDTWACTMSQAYVLDERQGGLNLDFLTRQHFGFSIKSLNQVDTNNLNSVPLSQVLPYNGGDAKWHRNLFIKQRKLLKQEKLTTVYKQHMRRVRAAVLTQIKGLPIDRDTNEQLLEKYNAQRNKYAEAIKLTPEAKQFYQRKGNDYRPSANQETSYIINNFLPEEVTAKARDGNDKIPNVQESTLEKINHPFVKLLLRWRKPNKVITTYLEPLELGTERSQLFEDGTAHPQLRTTTVVTWRTSSEDPNNQNFPKRDGDRKEVRGQIKKKGHKVVSFDYAGIQARNIAMESLDEALIKAFKERYDIHADWCEAIARLAPRWVKEGVKELAKDKKLFKSYRDLAKNKFVFPSMFGAKPTTVAHYMGVDNDVGFKLQDMLWERFPGIHKWHKRLLTQYRDLGYVTGHSGWRRRAPISPNELINTPIQSDEAIIVCDALNRLSEARIWALQPNMEIHDDLTFIWPEKEVEQHAKVVIDTMVNTPFKWAHVVPLGVEMSIGDDWYKQDRAGEYFTDTWKGSL